MDDSLLRLALCAAFTPDSARLGRVLRDHPPGTLPIGEYRRHLPAGRDATVLLEPGRLSEAHDTLRRQGWRWLALGDADYPPLLSDLPDAPGVLAVRGEVAALSRPQLAMVGARGASADGLDNAFRFARTLAGAGFVITSGLALGVDGAAHRGALAGAGATVAVLGGGPDRIYPPRHGGLADAIVEGGGALVTEFAPGSRPRREHFPQRNRIISGLSLATLVVEAALRSGSLITARTAAEQGREVFAIPGSIHNPLSRGCHRLLRDGANWLENVDDLLRAFGDFQRLIDDSPALADEPALLKHFTGGVNNLDALQVRSGLSAAQLADQLAELELEGRVERLAGGYARRSGLA
ncbi:DNA-processing protein DprA [Alloalcanivorax mobilis]|uniref:DNA-processing protein DprA n=1 Tax=Alloalcanivorax mobilis TaxID=2019569 RepID=UPI000C76DDE2|nr:DNA-processing protein DprA [Alloalcanivorax mobilis]